MSATKIRAGPCQIAGGPCYGNPTALYESKHVGLRALCHEHATMLQYAPAGRALLEAAPDMLVALKAQHSAIDELFATLIILTRQGEGAPPPERFMPSESGQPWAAMLQGTAAIAKAEGPE